MLTDFPEIAIRKCMSRLFEVTSQEVPFTLRSHLQDYLHLFAAFTNLLFLTSPTDITPSHIIQRLLHYADEAITSLFTPLSLQSLLHAITYVHAILRSMVSLFEAPADDLTDLPFPPTWRADIQESTFTALQNWIEEAFQQISQSSREFIMRIQSINELAAVKRAVRETSLSIRKARPRE